MARRAPLTTVFKIFTIIALTLGLLACEGTDKLTEFHEIWFCDCPLSY